MNKKTSFFASFPIFQWVERKIIKGKKFFFNSKIYGKSFVLKGTKKIMKMWIFLIFGKFFCLQVKDHLLNVSWRIGGGRARISLFSLWKFYWINFILSPMNKAVHKLCNVRGRRKIDLRFTAIVRENKFYKYSKIYGQN